MTATVDTPRASAPWHLWLVGVVALLWNGFGAYDYVMTQLKGDAYMKGAGMTDAQVAYFHQLPVWMTGVWAVGVWGGVLGAVLLLLRSKWAFHVFVASFAAFLVSVAYAYLVAGAAKVMGPQAAIMDAAIAAGCIVFIWYSQAMAKRGVLR